MKENHEALQELYRELDTVGIKGDINLIKYGEMRALGYDHSDAIAIVKGEKVRYVDIKNRLLRGKG